VFTISHGLLTFAHILGWGGGEGGPYVGREWWKAAEAIKQSKNPVLAKMWLFFILIVDSACL
jgi:hypothetical protein